MSSVSASLDQLISGDDLLRQFFRLNVGRNQAELALQLMREAVTLRMQTTPVKHHHVAYIKHNRFLSPSQKQEVTAKVTQMIPVHDHPNKIYAKPKPKPTQQPEEPPKSQQEMETRQEIPSREALPSPKPHRNQNQVPNEEEERHEESEKYLSPKTHNKPPKGINQTKTKQYASPPTKQTAYHSPPAVQSSTALKIESNYHSGMGSPKAMKEDYGRVESRIKFLIDRDKQSKRMERTLQAQSEKIEKLEERQERLLLLQYEQERELLRTHQESHLRGHPAHSESDSSSDKGLSRISSRLEAIEQRADGVREYQSRLYANLEKMRDKTYKISSNPVYPITSSSEQEDSL